MFNGSTNGNGRAAGMRGAVMILGLALLAMGGWSVVKTATTTSPRPTTCQALYSGKVPLWFHASDCEVDLSQADITDVSGLGEVAVFRLAAPAGQMRPLSATVVLSPSQEVKAAVLASMEDSARSTITMDLSGSRRTTAIFSSAQWERVRKAGEPTDRRSRVLALDTPPPSGGEYLWLVGGALLFLGGLAATLRARRG